MTALSWHTLGKTTVIALRIAQGITLAIATLLTWGIFAGEVNALAALFVAVIVLVVLTGVGVVELVIVRPIQRRVNDDG